MMLLTGSFVFLTGCNNTKEPELTDKEIEQAVNEGVEEAMQNLTDEEKEAIANMSDEEIEKAVDEAVDETLSE